jgi:hypothetical protein
MADRTQKSWRRRCARRAAFALVIGMVVNIGVAWWFAALTMADLSDAASDVSRFDLAGDEWPFDAPDEWPLPQSRAVGHFNAGSSSDVWAHSPLDERADGKHGSDAHPFLYMWTRWRSGWPIRSLERRYVSKHWMENDQPNSSSRGEGTYRVPTWCRRMMSKLRGDEVISWDLPLIPLWPGFAGNTAVYAALASIPLLGLPMARRRRRHRAGKCVECGYELAGAGICAECGHPPG